MGRYEAYPHVEDGIAYCRDVIGGKISACKWVKAACRRHLDDLERWSSEDAPFYFDADEAERFCRFAENHHHVKGEWARARLTIHLEPWQCFVFTCIFGWMKTDTHSRRFQTAYIEVPRKNAKSTMLAIAMLFCLTADSEAGAECYSLATTGQQAGIVFRVARQMALRDPEFCDQFGVQVNAHNLTVLDEDAKAEAMNSQDNTLDGLNIHFASVDEFHAHKTRGLWDVVETATGARKQPLIFAITTSGTNRAGICYEVRSYVCDILNSTLRTHDGMGYRIEGNPINDDSFFGIVYTIDDEDDWTLESTWRKANPNFGISVSPDDLRRKALKAMQRASAQPNFLTKHLDVWVNADAAWMDMLAWERQSDRRMRPEEFVGWQAFCGLDMASKTDFCSLVLVLRQGMDYRVFGKHYLPSDTIDDSDNSQYRGWSTDGLIVETEGATTDYDVIEADLREWVSSFGVSAVAYDPGFAWDFCQRMATEGLPMVEYRATVMNYSEPMKTAEEFVLNGTLRHDGNPAMGWMVSNVVCHRDAKDNIYPRKEREENKIDGAVALFAALGMALRNRETFVRPNFLVV